MTQFTLREHAPSILVAALASAFGVTLLQITAALAVMIMADDVTGSSGTIRLMLAVVAIVFIVIAGYVGMIVTANTFATIIAGRTRTIALLRLIGATARSQRNAVAREGLLVGIMGTVIGTVVGSLMTFALISIAIATDFIQPMSFQYFEPVLLIPIFGVVLTTWLASWIGSRRVLVVSPMQATGAAQEASLDEAAGNRKRNGTAITLFVIGGILLVLGMLLGLVSPFGVLIGVVGGIFSFTGLVLGAELVMPPALRLVGRMMGRSASARLAAENAVRYPERSSRTTIGLVIGVTLITMFAVAASSFESMMIAEQEANPEAYADTDQILLVTVVIFSVLIGFSALIAAVGMVNNLSLSVLQRTRELGLLRALGFTASQVRRMILAESAQLTLAAVLVGLVLGTFYGWAGAQSLLGAVSGFVFPTVPLALLGILIAASAVLTLTASIAPSRRATRVAPVAALGVQ